MKNKGRKLKDIDVAEISIVDSAANRKKFFITKRRLQPMLEKLFEILKSWMPEGKITDDQIEAIKKMGEDKIEPLADALTCFEEFKDSFTPKFEESVKTLIKRSLLEPFAVEAEEIDFVEELSDLEKAGKRFSKTTIAQLRKIKEVIEKLLVEETEKVDKTKDLPTDVIEQLAELKAMKKTDAENEKKKEKLEMVQEIAKLVVKEIKPKGKKTSLDVDAPDDDDDDKTKVNKGNKWPSLVGD